MKELLKGVIFRKTLSGGGTTHYGQKGWSVCGFVYKFVKCEIGTSLEGNECYFFNFGIEYSHKQVWDESGNNRSPLNYFKAEAGNKGFIKKDVDDAISKKGGLKENGFFNLWYLYNTISSEYDYFSNMKEWKVFVLKIFPDYIFEDEELLKEKKRLKDEYSAMNNYILSGKHEGDISALTIGNAMIEISNQYKIKYGESIFI